LLLNGSLNQNDYRLASIKGEAKQLISSAFVVVILKWSAEVLYLLHIYVCSRIKKMKTSFINISNYDCEMRCHTVTQQCKLV
jgi:hypothetical protein